MWNGLAGGSILNKHHAQGFSLLEVLVAFVVMGLVVGTLLQLYGTSMRSVATSDEMSFAILAAESQLVRVGRDIKVEEGSESGSIDNSPFSWKVTIEPIEMMKDQDSLAINAQPFKVTVTIEWESDTRKQRFFELSSIRFGERD